MNDLSKIFENVKDGETIKLDNSVYHVRADDSFFCSGYYCSNTAKKDENPNGNHNVAVFLKNKKDIIIDGNGACVIVHGKMTPLLFDRCENIIVKNLTIDYECPTMAEFTVVECKKGILDIQINNECLFDIVGNEIIWHGEKDCKDEYYWADSWINNKRLMKIYNPQTQLYKELKASKLSAKKIERLSDNRVRIYLKNKLLHLDSGLIIQTRNIVRDQMGSMFQRCKNLNFTNLSVKFMHGLGMVSQFCENVCYINCDFTPKNGRTIASTADFLHFSGCRGKLVIDSCKACGAHDDYVNVHGTHLRVVDSDISKSQLTVRFCHKETWGLQAFEIGDEIEFIKWDTLIPFAKSRVCNFQRLNDTDILLSVDNIPDGIVIGKDVVENATWTPDVYIKNCYFGPTSGRGILCTTRGEVIIENNNFNKLYGPALLVEDDCNFWFESGYTTNVIFKNNNVNYCDYGFTWGNSAVIRYTPKVMKKLSTAYVHSQLTLSENNFENSPTGKFEIHIEYLNKLILNNNIFDAPHKISCHVVGSVDEN